jgi:Na+-transporting NADH:ubiquinone oxidoreductase subunit C
MNTNSNKYIFLYATVMVVLVAAILSVVAVVLKPYQDNNVKVEKMQAILTSAGIVSTPADAADLYAKHIVREILIDAQGNVVASFAGGAFETGDRRAFDADLKVELSKKEKGETYVMPLFECDKDSEKLVIIPVRGKGLWGPVWGNLALKADLNTVAGATFDHKGETPGLGAEISTTAFQAQFVGKQIFDNGQFVSVAVVKGGVANSNINPAHGVDAISGGTITSVGVSDMLKDCLENYVGYIQKQTQNDSTTVQ